MCTLTRSILRHIQWVRKCSVEECFGTEVEWMEWKMVHCQRIWIFMVNMYCVLSIPWWLFNMPPGPFTHAESWQKEREEENGERERVNLRCFRTREKTFYLLKKAEGKKKRWESEYSTCWFCRWHPNPLCQNICPFKGPLSPSDTHLYTHLWKTHKQALVLLGTKDRERQHLHISTFHI